MAPLPFTSTPRELGRNGEARMRDEMHAAGFAARLHPNPCNPGFDVIVEGPQGPITVSVKAKRPTHAHPAFRFYGDFDFLACVRVAADTTRVWILPRSVAIREGAGKRPGVARGTHLRKWRITDTDLMTNPALMVWENNFALRTEA